MISDFRKSGAAHEICDLDTYYGFDCVDREPAFSCIFVAIHIVFRSVLADAKKLGKLRVRHRGR
jgi:hypothetical protein